MIFQSPVGRLTPKGQPWDGIGGLVTRTCIDHRATNQGCALDIITAPACGSPVRAAQAGVVVARDEIQGIIRIRHTDKYETGYAHMRNLQVAPGEVVEIGEYIGDTGDAHDPLITNFSGCHLHFSIRLAGIEVDPWPLLLTPLPDTSMEEPVILSEAKYTGLQLATVLPNQPLYKDTDLRELHASGLPSFDVEILARFEPGLFLARRYEGSGALFIVKGESLDQTVPVRRFYLSLSAENALAAARTAIAGAKQAIIAAEDAVS